MDGYTRQYYDGNSKSYSRKLPAIHRKWVIHTAALVGGQAQEVIGGSNGHGGDKLPGGLSAFRRTLKWPGKKGELPSPDSHEEESDPERLIPM